MAKTTGSIHKGGTTERLLEMKVGESLWVETSEADYAADMRKWNKPLSRRPDEMKDWVISTGVFTAISHGNSFDIRYLLEVRRLK